mmetsp:Transcript_3735/g.9013  ORF Transcript_3735/g.9013 Transcript_3735/m.9013 type:complete len:244 (-) Transcript_3735:1932-2663(-)
MAWSAGAFCSRTCWRSSTTTGQSARTSSRRTAPEAPSSSPARRPGARRRGPRSRPRPAPGATCRTATPRRCSRRSTGARCSRRCDKWRSHAGATTWRAPRAPSISGRWLRGSLTRSGWARAASASACRTPTASCWAPCTGCTRAWRAFAVSWRRSGPSCSGRRRRRRRRRRSSSGARRRCRHRLSAFSASGPQPRPALSFKPENTLAMACFACSFEEAGALSACRQAAARRREPREPEELPSK